MTAKVMVGVPFGGGFDPQFDVSLHRLRDYDRLIGGRYLDHKDWLVTCGGTSIVFNRNEIVRQFLKTDCEWLWFVDTDETFDPDIVEKLIKSADPTDKPIISGLVMAYRPESKLPVTPACNLLDGDRPVAPPFIPADNPWKVAGVGAGCLFVHRSVYEKIQADGPESHTPWFQNAPWTRTNDDGTTQPDTMGEDYVFSLRAIHAGYDLYVDTDIRCGHRKVYEFTVRDFWTQLPPEAIEPRTYVIIPVKDETPKQTAMTKALLKQLNEQGGYHGIFVLDNGSGKETRRFLDRQTVAEVLPMPGVGIHTMWNTGALASLVRWPRCNLVFLNNDLKLGDNFLSTLTSELRSREDLVALSPNYDGRTLDGIEDQKTICGNKYDGTGGVPGFAFAVKSELFDTGYRFPDECMWWFGDNDLLQYILAGGGAWGITPSTTVEHLNGGGQTGDWDAYVRSPQYEIDRKAFIARWS